MNAKTNSIPEAKPARPVAPAFSPDRAEPCAPTRHELTGRTFCFRQADGTQTHLFSATRLFVATVSAQ